MARACASYVARGCLLVAPLAIIVTEACIEIAPSSAERGIIGGLWTKSIAAVDPLPSASHVGCDKSGANLDYKHEDKNQGYHFHLKDDCTKNSHKVADICQKICLHLVHCKAYEAYGGSGGFNCLLFSSFSGRKHEPAKHGLNKLTGSGYACDAVTTPVSTTTPGCRLAVEGEQCHKDVHWAMTVGIHSHPQWYPGLSDSSSFADFQDVLSRTPGGSCWDPCIGHDHDHAEEDHSHEHDHEHGHLLSAAAGRWWLAGSCLPPLFLPLLPMLCSA